MDPSAFLSDLSVLIRDDPWLLVLATGLGPLLLALVVERIGRRPPDAEEEGEAASRAAVVTETREPPSAPAQPQPSPESDRSVAVGPEAVGVDV